MTLPEVPRRAALKRSDRSNSIELWQFS